MAARVATVKERESIVEQINVGQKREVEKRKRGNRRSECKVGGLFLYKDHRLNGPEACTAGRRWVSVERCEAAQCVTL